MAMIDDLMKRDDYKAAAKRAERISRESGCSVHIGFKARCDYFTVSDWIDDATIGTYYKGEFSKFE